MNDEQQGAPLRPMIATPADLAAAREARGMSQLDISQRIKLQTRQVAALEEGQWDVLPGRAFVRGALRSYAKLIDVDVAPLLESIGGVQPEPALAAEAASVRGSVGTGMAIDRASRSSPMLWVIGGLIGVVALVLYFGADQDASKLRSWLPNSGQEAQTAGNTAGSTVDNARAAAGSGVAGADPARGDALATGASTSAGAGAAGGAGGAIADAGREAANRIAAAKDAAIGAAKGAATEVERTARDASGRAEQRLKEAAEKAKADTAKAEAAKAEAANAEVAKADAAKADAAKADLAKADTARTDAKVDTAKSDVAASGAGASAASDPAATKGMLRFTTVDDSWIEVRGKDGKALHASVVKAGETITVQGQPPYRLTLGNAQHLSVEYEGNPRKLPPASPKNITRLVLP